MNKYSLRTVTFILCLFTFTTSLFSQIIINEVHADVALGLAGDANGDGIRNARDDEFIELFNNSTATVDISGFTLEVSEEIKHEFALGTSLPSNSFILIFGGGQPQGIFGNSPFQLASKGSLGLENSGTHIDLKDKTGKIIDSLTYAGTNIDASWVRQPDIIGDFIRHDRVSDAFGKTYSPGTLSNSFPYNNGDTTLIQFATTRGTILERKGAFDLFLNLINPQPTAISVEIQLTGGSGNGADVENGISQTVLFPVNSISQRKVSILIKNDTLREGNETLLFTLTDLSDNTRSKISINNTFELTIYDDDFDIGLRLTEILADPPNGIVGDANQDGTRDTKQDEFLEFVNISEQAIDLSGIRIYDAEMLRHKIPLGTILAPNQYFLVFGGGELMTAFGAAIVQTSSTKDLSLANTGDQIWLRDSLDNVVLFYEYGMEIGNNQSLAFCPNLGDVEGPKTLHSTIDEGQLFSPGLPVNCELKESTSILQEYEKAITIYPNPAKTQLNIDFPATLKLENASLLDVAGKTIFSTKKRAITFPTRMAKGVYFLKLQTDKGMIVKKLLIH